MLWLVKCLHVDRCAVLLTVSHSFNITLLVRKVFLKPRFWATNSNFFARIFTYPSAPRVFISLCQSWCYSSCWSELSRSVCLHSYFILNRIISSHWHWWWELDVLTFQWQVNCWRVDQRHQRHVSRILHPFPSLRLPLAAHFAHRLSFSPARFFSPFPPMPSLVPSYSRWTT